MRKVQTTMQTAIILFQQIQEFNEDCQKESFKLPGDVSFALFMNEQKLIKLYNDHIQKRQELLFKYGIQKPRTDDKEEIQYETEVVNNVTVYKLTDGEAYDLEYGDFLNSPVEIELEYTGNVSKKMENVIGEQKLFNKFFYLVELFNNFGKVKKDEQTTTKGDK